VAVDISPEENNRLRAKIDKRILVVMIFTYFIQALDKGTLSFASIMGIQADAKLKGQEYAWLTTGVRKSQPHLGIFRQQGSLDMSLDCLQISSTMTA
jgi:hypothetical protein